MNTDLYKDSETSKDVAFTGLMARQAVKRCDAMEEQREPLLEMRLDCVLSRQDPNAAHQDRK